MKEAKMLKGIKKLLHGSGASLDADVGGSMDTRAAGREAHKIWERTRGDENECDAERRFREDTEHSTEWWNGWLERSDKWRDEIGHESDTSNAQGHVLTRSEAEGQ